ncbi:hypothetical protein AB4454_04850 [Vibrio artabrorum]
MRDNQDFHGLFHVFYFQGLLAVFWYPVTLTLIQVFKDDATF